jgi:hypothetical protein
VSPLKMEVTGPSETLVTTYKITLPPIRPKCASAMCHKLWCLSSLAVLSCQNILLLKSQHWHVRGSNFRSYSRNSEARVVARA